MLPEGEFVFLDELFNANSAILNNLLTVLNERTYRRGAEIHRLPLLSLFAASNQLPEDDALRALFDRFLLRCHVDNLRREEMPRLLAAGWELEQAGLIRSSVSAGDLRSLAGQVYRVDLEAISEPYSEVVWKVRDLGVELTDRRAVKVLKLVAASAVLCGRGEARVSDFWVLRYLWDREEQVAPLAALVAGVIEPHAGEPATHPLAASPVRVDPEQLARQLAALAEEIHSRKLGVAAATRAREQLTDLADRAAWLADGAARQHLVDRARDLLKYLG
jgi:MoxR-like ATPase